MVFGLFNTADASKPEDDDKVTSATEGEPAADGPAPSLPEKSAERPKDVAKDAAVGQEDGSTSETVQKDATKETAAEDASDGPKAAATETAAATNEKGVDVDEVSPQAPSPETKGARPPRARPKLRHPARDGRPRRRPLRHPGARQEPVGKTTYTIVPEQLAEKAPSTPDATPKTHITLPGRRTSRESLVKKLEKIEIKKLGQLWWIEAAWWGVALLSFIIIAAVLSAYDNHPLATLPLNLNAFLAFFTTVATISFLTPVSQSLSQWNRSLPGCVMLLAKLKHTHIASAGAFMGLLALFTATVTQAAVGYQHGHAPLPGEGAAVVRAARILGSEQEGGFADGIVGALGLDVLPFRLPVTCATAECEFPALESLAVCAKVRDVTSLLTEPGAARANSTTGTSRSGKRAAYSAALPSEAKCSLESDSEFNVLACKTDGSTTLSFGEDDDDDDDDDDENLRKTVIYSMPIIYSNPNSTESPIGAKFEAVEIVFHLCLNTYETKVTDGVAEFSVTGSSYAVGSESADREVDVSCAVLRSTDTNSTTAAPTNCTVSRGGVPSDAFLELDGEDGIYKAHFATLEDMALTMNEALSGLYEREPSQRVVGRHIEHIAESVVFNGDQDKQRDRISRMADNIAVSLTNTIGAKQLSAQTPGANPVSGTAFLPETRISIRWGALTLLILQLIGALVFLVYTAIATQQAGCQVLKSSALATLFALEEDCRGVAGASRQPRVCGARRGSCSFASVTRLLSWPARRAGGSWIWACEGA
ncbi:unnamed protein product [Parascedosporium putredinis]|uniref:Uncharacterized protein n=1 Tax=Parascedosporium putredinis TaxID=1442378 RepID=A0A9P1MFY0_9PEZI|nr:unnamed protein product [Parascedosporium putredinis]CAI8003312.1 unnamed protein product [Parascedosporium putredinis]